VTNQRDLLKVKGFDHCREVVGIAIHVVSGGGLAGPAVATPVVRDDAETVLREEKHLPVPHVGIQGPAVREGNGRASAPVLVVNLRSIFRCDCTHETLSFFCCA
jgi:hypothetical protein